MHVRVPLFSLLLEILSTSMHGVLMDVHVPARLQCTWLYSLQSISKKRSEVTLKCTFTLLVR